MSAGRPARSVEGEVFHRGAVVELSEPRARLTVPAAWRGWRTMASSGRAPSFANEAAYEFRHILIRDAAYRATLKKLRAELHERFAGWLERIAGDRVTEYEEILGFHLEQAYRYREDLGATAPYRDLAERAAKWLGSAGTRAAGRGDAGAAIKLLERTLALLPNDAPGKPELLLMLGESLWGGLDPRAEKAFEASAEAAVSAGRKDIEASARLSLAFVGTHLNRGSGTADLRRAAEEWLPVAEELGDDRALTKGWFALANLEFAALHFADSVRLFERSMTHARRRGLAKDQLDSTFWMSKALGHGPEPVEEAIWRLEQLAEQATTLAARAILLEMVALMHAHAGRFPTAHALVAEAKATFEDLGLQYLLLDLRGLVEAQIAELEGDLATAERAIRWGCTNLEVIGETGALLNPPGGIGNRPVRPGPLREGGSAHAPERTDRRSRRSHDAGLVAMSPGESIGAKRSTRGCRNACSGGLLDRGWGRLLRAARPLAGGARRGAPPRGAERGGRAGGTRCRGDL